MNAILILHNAATICCMCKLSWGIRSSPWVILWVIEFVKCTSPFLTFSSGCPQIDLMFPHIASHLLAFAPIPLAFCSHFTSVSYRFYLELPLIPVNLSSLFPPVVSPSLALPCITLHLGQFPSHFFPLILLAFENLKNQDQWRNSKNDPRTRIIFV